MKCPSCGSEVPAGNKFCTSCGATMGDATTQMEQVTPAQGQSPQPPSPPAQPTARMPFQPVPTTTVAPPPPVGPATYGVPGTKKKKTGLIIAVVLIALLVSGGAVAGIIAWRVAEGNKLVAEIQKIDLKNADKSSLDLKDVPLDSNLLLEVTYQARFKEGGKGTLDITLVDGRGDEVISKTYGTRSNDKPQTQAYEYVMSMSEGETFKVTAGLKVSKGDDSLKDQESLEYYVAAGKGEEMQFDEAKAAATRKIEEATGAVGELAALGIESNDLTSLLLDATTKLQAATTSEEANAAIATADAVIAECASRKAAQQAAAQAVDVCRKNQAQIKDRLRGYYDEGGNFPNSMSDLGSLPACPSGGVYTYSADLFRDPPGLSVSCSVHGSL